MSRRPADRAPSRSSGRRAPSAPRTLVVRDARTLAAMRSPVRQRLLALLERDGPQTVGELAEQAGRTPESLYHHVRVLVDAGLIVDRGKRPATRRPESVYALAARTVRSDPGNTEPAYLDALAATWAAALRFAGRTVGAALRDPRARRAGSRRNCGVMQLNVRLSASALKTVNARLDELRELLEEADAEGVEAPFYSVTIALSLDPGSADRPVDA